MNLQNRALLTLSCVLLICCLTAKSSTSKSHKSNSSSFIQFTQSSYNASIPENSLGKVYVWPDARMGIFSNDSSISIRYKIRSGDPDKFFKAEAERVGDFVFLTIRTRTSNPNVLNRERKAHYALEVRARIKSANGQARVRKYKDPKTVVHVDVTDTNDLDPFFQPSKYTFHVPEDTPVHASVGRVRAEDADEGVNGEIYYSMAGQDSDPPHFAVDPVSGEVLLTRPLSFRDKSTYELTVVAQDRGPKPTYAMRQADTAKVHIKVVQVSNEPLLKLFKTFSIFQTLRSTFRERLVSLFSIQSVFTFLALRKNPPPLSN